MDLMKKYKNYYEYLIKEYTESNINGCNDSKIEFFTTKLDELKIKMERSKVDE